MYISKDIDIPSEIFEALEKRELVIFAGAGVSMPEPSNLPSFDGLAYQIATQGLGAVPREKGEAVDVYLGRLKEAGVQVHELTANILGKENSLPTDLHHSLLDLFSEVEDIKIVTTNFDRHFSKDAKERCGREIETYYAPALPLGNKFKGIVYLHGCMNKDASSMVLTDADFGHAYLTAGWATRFLQSLFASYTVLFIGYSHSDPIMKYLARGLALHQNTKRYAFTLTGQKEYWKSFDITPIEYPKRRGKKPHNALSEGVVNWARLSRMGILDHDDRIKKIVSNPPSLENEIIDYIDHVLNDPVLVKSFRRHAKGLDWLQWVSEKPTFKSLFETDTLSETSQELARWAVEEFMLSASEELFKVVQKRNQMIHPILWNYVAWMLAYKDLPQPQLLKKWVAVLLNTYTYGCHISYLEYTLNRNKTSTDGFTIIHLFEFLTKPRIQLKPSFAAAIYPDSNYPATSVEVKFLGSSHWLQKAWKNGIRLNLQYYVDVLLPILIGHLSIAHLLLVDCDQSTKYFDSISYSRSAIEPHEQDRYPKEMDVLIDATRDVLEWIIVNRSEQARMIIASLIETKVPILMRIAIHGMAIYTTLSSDEKLKWVIENNLLYYPGMKHEIFHLLKMAYPTSSVEVKQWLIDEALKRSVVEFISDLSDRSVAYRYYNLLIWLQKWSEDCNYIASKIEEILKNNTDFMPREHPDLDKYTYGPTWHDSQPSQSLINEIITIDLEDILTVLNRPRDSDSPKEDGFSRLLVQITTAVSQDFNWSLKLLHALIQSNMWETEAWRSIFQGWQQTNISPDNWEAVIDCIKSHKKLEYIYDNVSDFLLSAIKKEEEGSIPDECLARAEEISILLIERSLGNESEHDVPEETDWLGTAINRPGGRITEFMMYSLSRTRKTTDSWSGLPKQYKHFFEIILTHNNYSSQMGRVIIATQARFLLSLDKDWTIKNVLPLFNWNRDIRTAQQAWDGFLVWGEWNELLLEYLMPHIEATFLYLNTHLTGQKDRFCEHLANIAMFSSFNPIEHGWLYKFINSSDSECHASFAGYIGSYLEDLDSDAVCAQWERWLRKYISSRVRGIPIPFSVKEIEEIVEWSVSLGPAMPEIVEYIRRVPAPPLEHTSLYYNLEEKHIGYYYPHETAKLMLHLLPQAFRPFYHYTHVVKVLEDIVISGGDPIICKKICENLVRLGCEDAIELQRKIPGPNKTRKRSTDKQK